MARKLEGTELKRKGSRSKLRVLERWRILKSRRIVLNDEVLIIMGYPAAGKSRYSQQFVDEGYTRLNRDTLGGTLKKLIAKMEALYLEGKRQFVLDNTYPSAKSRKPVIEWAQNHNLPIRCILLDTSIEDAQYNAVYRMIKKYDKILSPEEIKDKKKDPNMFPPAALFRYRKLFEPPSVVEGFSSVEKISFERDRDPVIYVNKAVIFDYDGTLRISKGGEKYPILPDDIEILPNRSEVIHKYQQAGYLLLGVSNQSSIGKGVLTSAQAIACFERTNKLLGVWIDYRFCPHSTFPVRCYCHKPMIGFGVEFIEYYKLDPTQTIMVGDMKKDETFAKRCGFQYVNSTEFFKE
ncbi:MAG: HAD-IIIA family hydrolase [Candidatus Hermodarchaeota archaeon]